jgi:predicted nucleic acid-binding protein
LIRDDKLLLAFSYISRYENNNSPHSRNKIIIERFFENAVSFIDIDKADVVESRANNIMRCGVKAKDALHISCAIEACCNFFITTDDGILKKYNGEEIRVCSPFEFINLWEDVYA